MNPRPALALPVVPAVVHALTLRWAASDLVEHGAAFADAVDVYRALSVGLSGFAAVLALVAALATLAPARVAGAVLLALSLVAQALWLAALALTGYEDLAEQGTVGAIRPVIVYANLGTAVLFAVATVAALVLLRRTRTPVPA